MTLVALPPPLVVHQQYETDVNKEHVIRGNSAIFKCVIPSFVADFVSVTSWITNDADVFYPSQHYGNAAAAPLSPPCITSFPSFPSFPPCNSGFQGY